MTQTRSKRPRSPAGEVIVTSPVEGNGREVKDVTVTDFTKIVMRLAGRNLFKPEEAEIIINAFQNSKNLTNNDNADLRDELLENAMKARTGRNVGNVKSFCRAMESCANELSAAVLKANKPATFDALWKAASSVFSASFDSLIATRFILLEDFTATESTKPFELNMVKPAPMKLLLDGRYTKAHMISGESGIGKTVTLLSGACGPDTYAKTLGVYMKASKFTLPCPVDENKLRKLKKDARNRLASKFIVGRVKRDMEDFLEAGNFSPIAPDALKDRGLVVCIDELVSRPLLVRAIIGSYATITSEITKVLGFGKLVIVLAGTGIEGATLAPGSDPNLYEIHTLPAGDRQQFLMMLSRFSEASTDATGKLIPKSSAPRPVVTTMESTEPWERFPELNAFIENRRLSYQLAQALSAVPSTMVKFPGFGWSILTAMQTAANMYKLQNGLKDLSPEGMSALFAQILCATMLGPSFHGMYSFDTAALTSCLRDDAVFRPVMQKGDVRIHGKLVLPAGVRRRYHMTASLQMALQLLVGGVLTVEYGEEFEDHFASYAACCYLAVSELTQERMRTAATFLALLSQGSKEPLNLPLPAWALSQELSGAVGAHCLPRTPIDVVVLRTKLKNLFFASDACVVADLAALEKASVNAVTIVMTARADSAADIVVVIRGLGMLPISCKKYEADSTSSLPPSLVWEELLKMGAAVEKNVQKSKEFASRSIMYKNAMRNLGIKCGLEGDALRILGFQFTFVTAESANGNAKINMDVNEVVPMSLGAEVSELSPVPVKYLACGSTFENTFPLQRFTSIDRETRRLLGGAARGQVS